MDSHPQPNEKPRGRPRTEKPRDQVIKVSLSSEEYAWIVSRARIHDLALADYCRRKILGRSVPVDESQATSSGFWSGGMPPQSSPPA
jgi:hypothetical protein